MVALLTQNATDSGSADLVASLIKMLGSLGICLAVLFVGVYLLKRFKLAGVREPSSKRIKIIERLSLAHNSQLLIVEIEGEKFVVGSASGNISIERLERNSKSFDSYVDDIAKAI